MRECERDNNSRSETGYISSDFNFKKFRFGSVENANMESVTKIERETVRQTEFGQAVRYFREC